MTETEKKYDAIRRAYPETISKDQFYRIAHISKATALCKCCPEVGKASGELVDHLSSGSKSEHRSNLVHEIEREHIREVEKNKAFGVELLFHSSTPRSLVLTLTFSLCLALDCSWSY